MVGDPGLLIVLVVVPLLAVVASLTTLSLVLHRRVQQRRRLPAANPLLLPLPGQPGLNTNYESIVTHPIDIPQTATVQVEEYPVPPLVEASFGSAQSAETLVVEPATPSLFEIGSPSLSEPDIFPLEDDFPVVPTNNPERPVEEQTSLEPERELAS